MAAASEPSTKLVRCGADSCLRIVGNREDPASVIRINGHLVPVEGDDNWQAYLADPLVRAWSVPHARAIEGRIEALAAMQPEALPVVEEMRLCLDAFDLNRLATIARASQNHAG
jgi:hypothetical protein